MKALIVCDVQPDVVNKLAAKQQFVDLIQLTIEAARLAPNVSTILYTQLFFEDKAYSAINKSHPKLGVLPKLAAAGKPITWFTSKELSVATGINDEANATTTTKGSNTLETVVRRTNFLPHANHTQLLEVLQNTKAEEFILVGYGPTVQALCHILGDVLAIPNTTLIKDCIRDEFTKENRESQQSSSIPPSSTFLDHSLYFQEQVVSLVDFLESCDFLHQKIPLPTSSTNYVCDTGRGGHLTLFLPYLVKNYGYTVWPTQPWYSELSLGNANKEYFCSLARRVVELCDEPQFGFGTKFFLAGRQFLDEKNLLHDIVPELMPPTFATLEEALQYAKENETDDNNSTLVWFLKKVNQNGGRAISILHTPQLAALKELEEDDQLQLHIPRPLLFPENHTKLPGQYKCQVKTYQYLACCQAAGSKTTEWQLYMHDLYYLATANQPWSPHDLSDDVQVTTMRTHRLYPDNAWRLGHDLTDRIRKHMTTIITRAVQQGKLQSQHVTTKSKTAKETDNGTQTVNNMQNPKAALQFEINSADWMLDEEGRIYLIEINGIPVLYDPLNDQQQLCTKGLQLYDRLYHENPKTAVVNDHELLVDALRLALTGTLPKCSLWVPVATIPSPTSTGTY